MRGLTIILIALFNTVIWAGILHFGSPLVGLPIGTAWLVGILVTMLPLQLLALSMLVTAKD